MKLKTCLFFVPQIPWKNLHHRTGSKTFSHTIWGDKNPHFLEEIHKRLWPCQRLFWYLFLSFFGTKKKQWKHQQLLLQVFEKRVKYFSKRFIMLFWSFFVFSMKKKSLKPTLLYYLVTDSFIFQFSQTNKNFLFGRQCVFSKTLCLFYLFFFFFSEVFLTSWE